MSDDSRDHPPEDDYYLDEDHYHEDYDDDLEDESDGTEMTFLEHLEEARTTLMICVGSVIAGIILVFVFLREVKDFLQYPLKQATPDLELVTMTPMAVFIVMIQIGFIGGFIIALPVILAAIGKFIAPGLKAHEIKLLKPVLVAAFFLFLAGCSFCFFFLLPLSLKASFYFSEMMDFDPNWKAEGYYGLVVWMTLAIGLAFEYPLAVITLIKVGILNTHLLKKYRSYSVLFVLVISAIITPTADLTFLFLSGPLYLMYEGSILVGQRIEKKREQQEKEDDLEKA